MLTRSNSRDHHDRQHALDALQELLPTSKIIYDDPTWPSPLCQYYAVHHDLQQAKHPYSKSAEYMSWQRSVLWDGKAISVDWFLARNQEVPSSNPEFRWSSDCDFVAL